jgi:hypothetical protein
MPKKPLGPDLYGAYYAAQTGEATATDLQRVLALGVQGGAAVKIRNVSARGAKSVVTLSPANPVAPVSGSAPSPGFFQRVNADGTLGVNWTKVAVAAAGVLVVVGGAVALSRRKR